MENLGGPVGTESNPSEARRWGPLPGAPHPGAPHLCSHSGRPGFLLWLKTCPEGPAAPCEGPFCRATRAPSAAACLACYVPRASGARPEHHAVLGLPSLSARGRGAAGPRCLGPSSLAGRGIGAGPQRQHPGGAGPGGDSGSDQVPASALVRGGRLSPPRAPPGVPASRISVSVQRPRHLGVRGAAWEAQPFLGFCRQVRGRRSSSFPGPASLPRGSGRAHRPSCRPRGGGPESQVALHGLICMCPVLNRLVCICTDDRCKTRC